MGNVIDASLHRPYAYGSVTFNWSDGQYKVFPLLYSICGIHIKNKRPIGYKLTIKEDCPISDKELRQWESSVVRKQLA